MNANITPQKVTNKNYKYNQKTIMKMTITAQLSIITLNINGLKAPIS